MTGTCPVNKVKFEHLKIYQARLMSPRLEPRALPVPLPLSRDGTGLSPPQAIGAKRLSLLLEPPLHRESDKQAGELAQCLLGPEI